MYLTKEQRETLGECPTEEVTLDGREGWSLTDQDNDGRLEIKFRSLSLIGHWERFITVTGGIERYDTDTDTFVPATFEPLEGSYVSHNARGKITYRY